MSWGTEFTTDIFLSHLTFKSKGMLTDAITDKEDDIANIESHIKMWASSTPKDICIDHSDDVIGFIASEIEILLGEYRDTVRVLSDLRRYLEYVEGNNIDLTQKHEAD